MLSIISIDEAEKWDQVVRSFKEYDVYYLSGYPKAFRLHGDGEPVLFYYDDRDFRAINVVMIRDISKDKAFVGKLMESQYYDMATPYGYGGFLIEGNITNENLNKLDSDYTTVCRKMGIISEFVRFHPILQNHRMLGEMYDVSFLGRTVSIDLTCKEHIWSNLTSSNRNKIRKSQKSNVKVYWGYNHELYKEFREMYIATMDKDNAAEYYYFDETFFTNVSEELKYNSLMFYAVHDEKIVSMSIVLFGNNQMHYHLSGSNRDYQWLAPVNQLLYEASCWGSENGYHKFHLGGGLGSKEDSLYKFKSGFNRYGDNDFVIGRKILDEKKYAELVDIRCKDGCIRDLSFFPLYRG